MKEKIYTIPINEALEANSECAFCEIEKKLEAEAVEYTLGAALMEPDFRIQSNNLGYCNKHYSMLYAKESGNILGLSLLMQTHLEEIRREMKQVEFSGEKVAMFKKNNSEEEKSKELSAKLETVCNSCLICEKIRHTTERYTDTFFYMWEKDDGFKKRVSDTKGFCLNHYRLLIKGAPEKLSKSDANEFMSVMHKLQQQNLARLQEEIDWFIQKFDYRNQDAPWKNSKDAPIRLIEKLTGSIT